MPSAKEKLKRTGLERDLVIGLAAGLVAAVALSAPYAILQVLLLVVCRGPMTRKMHTFLVGVAVAAPLAYAWMVGAAIGLSSRLSGGCSAHLGRLAGAVSGLVGLYPAWVLWLYLASDRALLVLNPLALPGAVAELVGEGAWTVLGISDLGVMILFWGLEVALLCGLSSAAAGMYCAEHDRRREQEGSDVF
ncbi:MAG: hypothetical protein ACYTGB_05025 [Planctomycetota bacterium]|jgi:hypothetical protein